MTADQFWCTIAQAKAIVGDGEDTQCERQAAALEVYLCQLPPTDIVDFDWLLRGYMNAANDWRLWGAAYIINGGCSDDGFDYFRCWLIAQGKDIFTSAVQDPDTLVDVVDGVRDDYEGEAMLYAASLAYEATTKSEMPPPEIAYGATRGTKWSEDGLVLLLPRLAQQYGWT